MTRLVLNVIAAAVMCCAGVTASQAQAWAGPNRPSHVPPGYIITPFGYFDPGCVAHLAERDVLRSDQHLIQHADGTATQMPACAHVHYSANGDAIGDNALGVTNPTINGWVEYASVTTTSAYGLLSAQFSVPYTPASKDGQTLFYFPGLEDSTHVVTILQPVLGWNSDFPSAWGIASWNCCQSGTVFEATPQRVSPGDTIYGVISCASGGTACTSWNVVTTDMQNGKSSQLLATSSFGQTFSWAFGGVLEVYNVVKCSDFPGNGSISFNNLQLASSLGRRIPHPKWSFTNLSSGFTPQCFYGGELPAQVVLQAIQ